MVRGGRNKSSSSPDQTTKDTQSIHEKLDLILERLDKFDVRLKKIEKEQKELTKSLNFAFDEIDSVKADVEQLKTRKSLDDSVEALEGQNRQKQLVITQIPYRQDENLIDAIQKIADKLKCNITAANDIDSKFRVKKLDRIIGKFIHSYKRDSFYSLFKKSPQTTSDLGFTKNDKIFVNELLSPEQGKLYKLARDFRKEHNYKFVWTANQKIFLRKTEDSPIKPVRYEHDLKALSD